MTFMIKPPETVVYGLRIQTEAGNVGQQDPNPAGGKTGIHNRHHAYLNGLCFRLGKAKTHGNEVAGALAVDGEQGRQGQLGGDIALADFRADQCADDLSNNRAGAKQS